jgi:hypothetical protein
MGNISVLFWPLSSGCCILIGKPVSRPFFWIPACAGMTTFMVRCDPQGHGGSPGFRAGVPELSFRAEGEKSFRMVLIA